jgi:23S rRNA (guanine745-N1)-methyltransferase
LNAPRRKPPPLRCTVRGCARPLAPRERAFACEAGHSFDVARSGYVNLLQPQDRRSREPGDSKARVEARVRLAERSIGAALLDELARLVAVHARSSEAWLADVGCGPGLALARVATAVAARRTGVAARGIGVDLSLAAIERASKRHRELDWIVANADRSIPFLDGSIDVIWSLSGPKNAPEFARVLRRNGRAIVAVPASDDLIELREAVLGEGREIERATAAITEFAGEFELEARSLARERSKLDAAALADLLLASYRGARTREAERARELQSLDVTSSSELLVFRPR